MVDATISRARLRHLRALGRSRAAPGGEAAAISPSASRRRTAVDGAAIDGGTSPRPNVRS